MKESDMVAPVKGYGISTPFGVRGKHWSCNRDSNGNGIHTGDDFPCPENTPLIAAIAGTIRHRNYGSAFGDKQFAISPSAGQPFANGEVFYAHGNERLADGTEVQVGQVIGKSGSRGNATGPHLHFEFHPNHKNVWNCGVVADPTKGGIYSHGGGGGSTAPPPSNGPYVTKDIYSNKLGYGEPTNGDAESDTVKELQERLNRIKLQGGAELPITGKYHDMTDAEVRKWQEQIVHDPPDPPKKSYLGPNQRAAMFPSPPYTIHDTGLPAIAGNSGGSGGSDGGGSGGSGGSGGGSGAPVAPALMLPGAVWNPIPNFPGLRPFTGSAMKITLHTTETNVKPNWEQQQKGIPHLTVDLINRKKWQHLPFNVSAYTLEGGEHSPNSDSGVNIQIEIIGYASASPLWHAADYLELQSILLWLSGNLGIPYVFPAAFGAPAQRLTWPAWSVLSGVLGHGHAPYNNHTDPGALDVKQLLVPQAPDPGPLPGPEEYITRDKYKNDMKLLAQTFQRISEEA